MPIERLKVTNFMGLTDLEIRPQGPVVTISGPNGAGKSSAFKAVEAVVFGKRSHPSKPIHEGAEEAEVELDVPGLRAVGKWTEAGNYYLKVRTIDGTTVGRGQEALERLFGDRTFNPVSFISDKPANQNAVLARLGGIDLEKHQADVKELYERRTDVNRRVKSEKARLDAMPRHPGADAELSADSMRDAIEKAAAARREYDDRIRQRDTVSRLVTKSREDVERLKQALSGVERELAEHEQKLREATEAAKGDPPSETTAIQERMREIEAHNAKVRQNNERDALAKSVAALEAQSEDMTSEMELLEDSVRRRLAKSALPIDGLAFSQAGPTLHGTPLDQCSTAEQIAVSVAVGMALNPNAQVMFIRDGSLCDDATVAQLTKLAAEHGIQIWRELVTNGEDVGFTIREGRLVGGEVAP